MENASARADELRQQISATERQLQELKDQLKSVEIQNDANVSAEKKSVPILEDDVEAKTKWPLSSDEYKRYGRQMIVPNFGIQGQTSFCFLRISYYQIGVVPSEAPVTKAHKTQANFVSRMQKSL
jgi:adenylyltransferase/sulfurtransferase